MRPASCAPGSVGIGERWLRIRLGIRRRIRLVLTAAPCPQSNEGQPASVGECGRSSGLGSEGLARCGGHLGRFRFDVATLRCDLPAPVGDVRWGRLVGSEPLDWKRRAFLWPPSRSRPRAEQLIRSGGPLGQKARGSPCPDRRVSFALEGNDDLRCGRDLGCGHFQRRSTGGSCSPTPSRYGTSLEGRRPRRSSRCRGYLAALGTSPASKEFRLALVSPDSQTCGALCRRAQPDLYRRDRGTWLPETRGGQRPAGCRRAGRCRKSPVAL